MKLNLQRLIHTPGEKLSFDFSMDLSEVDILGDRPFTEPVTVSGVVKNTAEVLSLDAVATSTLSLCCDRCRRAFHREKRAEIRYMLAQELQDEDSDDILLLEADELDMEDVAYTAYILDMDTKHLCSEDCKGLCPGCGADLNESACRCEPEVDPRWAALSQFLDKPE